MMSSTVLLSLLLINCVMAKLDLAKQEGEVEKFRKGEYPKPVDEIIIQTIELSERVYQSDFEDMETVRKNEPDKYAPLIKNYYEFIENILKTLKEKLKPKTGWSELYEVLLIKILEVGYKKLEQVKATIEGKDVKHFSKKNFMDDVVDVTNQGKKSKKDLKDKPKKGIEGIQEGIDLGKSIVSELAHIKINKDSTIGKTLIDGLTLICKKITAFGEGLIQRVMKH